MSELVARRHIERDPRPTQDLGRNALRAAINQEHPFTLTEADAEYMAYDGYPEVQAILGETSRVQDQPSSSNILTPTHKKESISDLVARTRYIATSTPLTGRAARRVETLTTEAL